MKTIRVVAALIFHEGKLFATQRGYGAWRDYWEFPGGKIEPGETPEEALVREIREELDTGITVLSHVCDVEYDYPEFHLSMQCFRCEITSGEPKLLEHEAAVLTSEDRELVARKLGDIPVSEMHLAEACLIHAG